MDRVWPIWDIRTLHGYTTLPNLKLATLKLGLQYAKSRMFIRSLPLHLRLKALCQFQLYYLSQWSKPSYFYPMMADHILNTCRLYYFQVWLMVGPDSQAFHRGKLSPFDQWPWLQSTHRPPHLPSFHHHIAPHFSLPQQFHWYFGWIFAVFPIDINVFVECASEFFRDDPPSLHGFHGFHQTSLCHVVDSIRSMSFSSFRLVKAWKCLKKPERDKKSSVSTLKKPVVMGAGKGKKR